MASYQKETKSVDKRWGTRLKPRISPKDAISLDTSNLTSNLTSSQTKLDFEEKKSKRKL